MRLQNAEYFFSLETLSKLPKYKKSRFLYHQDCHCELLFALENPPFPGPRLPKELPAGHGSRECKKVAYDGGLSMIDDAVEASANDSELEQAAYGK